MGKAALLGCMFAILPWTTARAMPATADEAGRLTTLFERYVGVPAAGQPAAVTVSPEGESYRMTVDLKQALKGLESYGVTIDPSVSTVILTPLADGTWKVATAESPPIVAHFGEQSIAIKAATTAFDSLYDPRMSAFKTIEAQYTGYDYSSTKPGLVQNSHSDRIGVTVSGMPADGGTVSGTAHEVVTGIRVDVLSKPPSPPPPSATEGSAASAPTPVPATTAVSYAAPTATLDLSADKLHSKNLLDIWAFLVAHPSRNDLAAVQDEFRGILRAALPLASALRESASAEGLSITTPIGPFTVKTSSGSIDVANLDGIAKATTTLAIGGLTVPPGQLPPWTDGLVPTDLSLTVGADGLHAGEAAAEAVNDFDLKSDRPFTPDQSTRIGHLAMPGVATVTLLPSRLTSKLLDLRLDGAATFGDAPDGHLSIRTTGLDKAIATLQAASASDPSAGQALGPLVLAKNLAKPQPDGSLSWLVELKGNGPVTVNGAPLQ